MRSQQLAMCHFVRADQRKKQGYKSDVSLKRGTNNLYPGNDATLYI